MRQRSTLTLTFLIDILFLVVAAPILYFPDRFPAWALWIGFALLGSGWLWRRSRLGCWWVRTPVDWALILLFFVMLPISIWAAPEPLRLQYSWPRAYILIWNFCLFWVVVIYGQRDPRLYQLCLQGFIAMGVLIALVAPLGIAWLYKFPLLDQLLQQIPAPLVGIFAGAESGFHPNQVAGTLLYVLPLALALAAGKVFQQDWGVQSIWWIAASLVMGSVLLLTQSRAGLLGVSCGVLLMLLLPWRIGQWLLLLTGVTGVMALPWLPSQLFDLIGNSPTVEISGGNSLGFRQEVWLWATTALYDFPFTGMGLGTFRQIVFLLYPINIDPNYNLGHAHNFFLQTGVDFGIPGLISILALYGCSIHLLLVEKMTLAQNRWLRLGLLGSLAAQTIYSQFDAVTLGAKTNLFFWWLLALIYAGVYTEKRRKP